MSGSIIHYAKQRYYYFSSLLLFLSFPSFDLIVFKAFPLFAWFALVPLYIAVARADKKDIFYIAFFTGFWGNLFTYNWIGHFGATVPGGAYVVLLFLIPFLTFFFAIQVWLAESLSRIFPRLRMVIFPAVWLAVGYTQSIGHLAFPWTYLGYSQYPLKPMVQLSALTGVAGVTALIVAWNCALALLFKDGKLRSRTELFLPKGRAVMVLAPFICLVMIAGSIRLFRAASHEPDLRVAMVQSCIDPWESWNRNRHRYLAELKRHTNTVLAESPDLVLWSESATLETLSYDHMRKASSPFQRDIFNFVTMINRPLLTGEIGLRISREDTSRRVMPLNNAVLIMPGSVVEQTYSKIHLVPFGEWFPYGKWLPAVQDLLDRFGASSFAPGSGPKLFSIKDKQFGTLICYEGIFSELARTYRKMGADFFVNITNDGWTDTHSGHMQHFAASVFRAVENGIWYVRAGNTGYTVIVDPLGRETVSLPLLVKGSIAGDIATGMNRKTFFTARGDLLTPFSMVFTCALILVSLILKVRNRRHE